ncbi:MAG TPA: ABC transporter substrate-binding protein [Hypericibacter adhaerens]|jgi:putative spermidine/putrescine transport system substrate-binding protein|uniref:Polyamine ABC transporter substrate-binding protein n=1 Tax=Hypericibacter adhaerens TaxID=2602016 RepID=A0A5J6N3V8_9PROT|nr:ABC transporter substrate-binding protein [Hypericibacter adhaerens]QEX23615.1 polyamine ABC transporter substrate-binding protein [Hypericibacter adhaerens]HWA41649.1 ABC transporter substrate-binding protein [Hypericibacter adhaerens]
MKNDRNLQALEIAHAYRNGRISRRRFIETCALLGIAPAALGLARSAAAAEEIVIANWGGDAEHAEGEGWGKPFTADTGIGVKIDGSGPMPGNIRSQVDEKHVIWDVAEIEVFMAIDLGRQGLLEPIDYSVVDKTKVQPGYALEFGICNYTYSTVVTYDTAKTGAEPPKTWVDFFNLEKYPGKRAIWKYGIGAWEAVLLGDGVAPEKLYPLDIDRAIKAARKLGDNIIYFESGADSQQMLLTGEIAMGALWHTRASVLDRDTKGKVTWTWNQGALSASSWTIPKGSQHVAAAQKFIASTQIPERQIEVFKIMGNGCANPAASAMLPPELARVDPGRAENLKQQVLIDQQAYAGNYDAWLNKWLDGISG